jgi:hypothetical protein
MLELLLVCGSALVSALALLVVTRAAQAGRNMRRGAAIWVAVLAMAFVGAMGVFVNETSDVPFLGQGLIVLAIIVGFSPVVADRRRTGTDGDDSGR